MNSDFNSGNVMIKASPEVMADKAGSIRTNLVRIRTEFSDMQRSMERTGAYWNGEAAELYRKHARQMKPAADEMFLRLEEHAFDLQEIAAIYIDVNTRIVGEVTQLPKDAIE